MTSQIQIFEPSQFYSRFVVPKLILKGLKCPTFFKKTLRVPVPVSDHRRDLRDRRGRSREGHRPLREGRRLLQGQYPPPARPEAAQLCPIGQLFSYRI